MGGDYAAAVHLKNTGNDSGPSGAPDDNGQDEQDPPAADRTENVIWKDLILSAQPILLILTSARAVSGQLQMRCTLMVLAPCSPRP
jgi:hypothetical protein